jgi:hypothetical protein
MSFLKKRRARFACYRIIEDDEEGGGIGTAWGGNNQCSGFELIFFGFGSTNFLSDSVTDTYTSILTRNFLKYCLSLLIYVFWNLYDREKSFPTEKLMFFLFQLFDQRFFTQICILQQCLDPNPNTNPKFFSGSDPAKIFGLFRIWIHNTGKNGTCATMLNHTATVLGYRYGSGHQYEWGRFGLVITVLPMRTRVYSNHNATNIM